MKAVLTPQMKRVWYTLHEATIEGNKLQVTNVLYSGDDLSEVMEWGEANMKVPYVIIKSQMAAIVPAMIDDAWRMQ